MPEQHLPINNGRLLLLPEGAALDPDNDVLLVADVHLGKAQSFRRLGVPVPAGTDAAGMRRLSQLLDKWQPARLVFLGDLLHDRLPGNHPLFDELARWRHSHPHVRCTLVNGNHDRKAGLLPVACGIETVEPGVTLGPLRLLHEPLFDERCYATPAAQHCANTPNTPNTHSVAGHIHPVVRVRGRGDAARVRCFWARPGLTVLPAFGEFTGGYCITPEPADAVYLLDGIAVRELPALRQ